MREGELRLLYIDGVGPLGGASRSLYEVVRAMPEGAIAPHFLMQRGTALRFYQQIARDVISVRGLTRFDNTRFSHYRGLRWAILLREILHFPFMMAGLLRARARWGDVDVIHVNEITELLPGLLARWLFGAPLAVHVRSLQCRPKQNWRTRWLNRALARWADAVVAIDGNVRATLPSDLHVTVINNSFSPVAEKTPDPAYRERLENLRPDTFKVGFVGNLQHFKGIVELVEAARIVRDAGVAVEFLIVGGSASGRRGFKGWLLKRAGMAQDIDAELNQLILQYGLENVFHLLGPTTEIHYAYEKMDVLCFPSHLDAPGRPVLEAAFYAVPSIVSVAQPTPDTLVHGETGIAIPDSAPERIAEAILALARDPAAARGMGENARSLAERNFHSSTNAKKLLSVYRELADRTGRLVGGGLAH